MNKKLLIKRIKEKKAEIEYLDFDPNEEYEEIINKVLEECFIVEEIDTSNLYIDITLTNPENIRRLNNEYRKIDKETDVLSFPMFEKNEVSIRYQNKRRTK